MSYEALYRRWRPKDFDTLVGQDTVKQALSNALNSGHIAHAYLFAGPRGTGKTSTARILAKALNCDKGPTVHPCGECQNCLAIAEGNSMDVLEIDAASNRGIDNIKELRDRIAFAPVDGRYKVYVIDEVHMLTTEAFNALLKTLEEPPDNVVFILATTDPHKVPATIHSRCQRFDFHRVTVDDITKHLVMVAKGSDIVADEEALRLIAIQAEGGMRDALSLLDQCAVISPRVTVDSVRETLGIVGREALRELVTAIGNYDAATTIAITHKLLIQGREASRILTELTEYLRALLLFKTIPEDEEIYLIDDKNALADNAKLFSTQRILTATEYIAKGMDNVKFSLRPRIYLEVALLHLCEREVANVEIKQTMVATPIKETVKPMVNPAIKKQEQKKEVVKPVEQEEVPLPPPPPEEFETAVPVQTTVAVQKKVEQKIENKAETTAGTDNAKQGVILGKKYWDEAIGYLSQEGKKAISSCAKNGQVVAFKDNVLTVLVSQFICDRISQDDYCKTLENAILVMQRVAVKCNFVTEYQPPKDDTPQPEIVKKALDVFGGIAIKED